MRTDELVHLLAAGAEPVDTRAPRRRYAAAFAAGVAIAAAFMFVQLGINPELLRGVTTLMFWVKLVFVVTLSLAAYVLVLRLARPGAELAHWPAALAVPVAAMWLLGLVAIAQVGPGERLALVLGQTWRACPWNIAMLSAPILIAILWSLKGFAPTRLRLTGAAAGALAGAAGATVYTLHCPELAAPFLAIWYILGALLPTALGALIGPRVLRW